MIALLAIRTDGTEVAVVPSPAAISRRS